MSNLVMTTEDLKAEHRAACDRLRDERFQALAERDEARAQLRILTETSRVLTCAFCGEAYPPGTPTANHEMLAAHVKVCAKHPMRETERLLDLRLQKQREAEDLLYEVRQERDQQVGRIFKFEAVVGLVRDALLLAVDGDVEPGETLVDTVKRLERRMRKAEKEIELAHAELNARGVPRIWGPNADYKPPVQARIARWAETSFARIVARWCNRVSELHSMASKFLPHSSTAAAYTAAAEELGKCATEIDIFLNTSQRIDCIGCKVCHCGLEERAHDALMDPPHSFTPLCGGEGDPRHGSPDGNPKRT